MITRIILIINLFLLKINTINSQLEEILKKLNSNRTTHCSGLTYFLKTIIFLAFLSLIGLFLFFQFFSDYHKIEKILKLNFC